MIHNILDDVKSQLQKGFLKRGHPFRCFTLATVADGIPTQRTVVLRNVTKDFKLTFYTDSRSDKLKQLEATPSVSCLFYNYKKYIQIKFEGQAIVEKNKKKITKAWSSVQASSRKDYTINVSPGTPIENPEGIFYLEDEFYFTIVHIIPSKIEYLKLDRDQHIRAEFNKLNDTWPGTYIAP